MLVNVNKTNLKKLGKEGIINLLEEAGLVFSHDLTVSGLIDLALSQKEQLKEHIALTQNNEEVNEMSEENVNVNEVAVEEVAEEVVNEAIEEVVENNEESVEDVVADEETVSEVENEIEEKVEEVTELVEIEVNGHTTEVPQQVADRIEEIRETAQEVVEELVQERKPKRGKIIKVVVNGEDYNIFPTIKACAAYFKEKFETKGMPFNQIMKSTRSEGQEPWVVGEDTWVFTFINKEDILTPSQKSKKSKSKDSENSDEKFDWSLQIEEMNEDQLTALEAIVEEENAEAGKILEKF